MLTDLSNELADAAAAAARSVVQVHGRRRPASGVVYANGVVLTTMQAIGREDGLRIRAEGGDALDAELAGWDPATGLALLKAPALAAPAVAVATQPARVGHLVLAIARSWSNVVTASAGIVSIIGGPLPTGRRRAIREVIRTTAPMHDGFAGGALLDTSGALLGITTAATIRGSGVVIPSAIAWETAKDLLQHGRRKRGYIGIAGQPARLGDAQRGGEEREHALLVVGVAGDGPAAKAGVLVGDIILALDGHVIQGPDDLLDLLAGDRVGKTATLRILRGGTPTDVTVTIGERSAS
jgi:S1-C subfamily serine protease